MTPLTLSSVPAQTAYIQYIATNGQTVFPYPFEITQDADLVCVINGVTQATDSGYTLSGQGNSTGGNLTFTSGRTTNDIVTLYRSVVIARVTQIAQNSGFTSTAFNAEFNTIYLILQDLAASLLSTLKLPNTNSPQPTTTLTPGAYANKVLGFDANGNPTPTAFSTLGGLTAAILGGLLYPQSTNESGAGVTPSNLVYPYGDIRRYGGVCDSSTDNTGAFTNALKTGYPVFFTPVTGFNYNFSARVVMPAGSTTSLNGSTLNWTALAATGTNYPFNNPSPTAVSAAIEITGNNVTINMQGGTIKGPDSGTYVAVDAGIYANGTSVSTPRKFVNINGPGTITQFGYAGVLGQFCQDWLIDRSLHVTGCGYIGIGFLSSLGCTVQNCEVDTITPGTSGNCYGIVYSYDSASNASANRWGQAGETDPWSQACWARGNLVHDIPIWTGIDAHNGYEITFESNTVYNCLIGLGSHSGPDKNNNFYGPQNGRTINNFVTTVTTAGATGGAGNTNRYGIVAQGGNFANAVNMVVTGNIIQFHGYTDLGSYSLHFASVSRGVASNNNFDGWAGYGIYINQCDNVSVTGNNFGGVRASTANDTCIYLNGGGKVIVTGNIHNPGTGTAAHYGVDIPTAADGPYVISGNDFDAAQTAAIGASGGNVNPQSLKGNSDMTPHITATSLSGNTVSVAAAGLAKEVVVYLNTSGGTINSITGSYFGQRVMLFNAANNTVTLSRTNAKLPGGAVAQLAQYDSLYLYCYNATGPAMAAIASATNNS